MLNFSVHIEPGNTFAWIKLNTIAKNSSKFDKVIKFLWDPTCATFSKCRRFIDIKYGISLQFSSFLYISLHFSAFLWISLYFSTFFWISSSAFSAFLLISLHVSAFLWFYLYFSIFLCSSLDLSPFLCISLHFTFYLSGQFDGVYRRPMDAILF